MSSAPVKVQSLGEQLCDIAIEVRAVALRVLVIDKDHYCKTFSHVELTTGGGLETVQTTPVNPHTTFGVT